MRRSRIKNNKQALLVLKPSTSLKPKNFLRAAKKVHGEAEFSEKFCMSLSELNGYSRAQQIHPPALRLCKPYLCPNFFTLGNSFPKL